MHNIVKNVFLLMLAVTVAFVLYWLFFGITATQLSGGVVREQIDTSDTNASTRDLIQGLESWEGLLFFTAREMENSISAYYYKYCYLPSVYSTAYLDIELGAKVNGVSNIDALDYNKMLDAGSVNPSSSISTSGIPTGGYYSVGWY